jgi:nucleotide-binding universal stress UspA family protein
MPVIEPKTSTRITLDNVLYATDFSAPACAALPYALAIGRHYESTLHVVHVVPEFDVLVQAEAVNPVTFDSAYAAQARAARDRMRTLTSELACIPHRTYVRRGKIWDVVAQLVAEQHIDLLVLGTHGREGIGKLAMGSVAESLLRHSTCPVLNVGPKAFGRIKEEFDETGKDIRPSEIELKHITFAVDFSPESLAAAPFALSLAEEFQARLGLLHVAEKDAADSAKPALERLESLIPQEAALWCRPEVIVKFGSPAEQILQSAVEANSDLIVLGVRPARSYSGTATHFPWSVAHKVIANARCPVFTVRK